MPHKHTELQLTLFCSVDIGPGSGLKTLSTGEERGERKSQNVTLILRQTQNVKLPYRRNKIGVMVSYQECIGTMSADDPNAKGLVLRFRNIAANVDRSQVDDAFTWQKSKTKRR